MIGSGSSAALGRHQPDLLLAALAASEFCQPLAGIC
jgi:hypothetical protein